MSDQSSNNNCADFLESILCKSPEQISVIANILTLIISKGRSAEELNVLGNFIVGVGSLLLTIAATMESCSSKEDKVKQINDLRRQVTDLENSMK